MTPHQMLDALSRQTGAALAFNGDGLCRLRFDGRFIVDLEVTDDEDAIYLYARLGTLPAGEQGRELMARMMRAHCLGRESGNTLFGLDGEEIMAFARVAAAEAGEIPIMVLYRAQMCVSMSAFPLWRQYLALTKSLR